MGFSGNQEPGAENFSRDSCPVVLSSAFRQEYGLAEDELDSVTERIPCRTTSLYINLNVSGNFFCIGDLSPSLLCKGKTFTSFLIRKKMAT